MKIGIFLGDLQNESGGAFTFQETFAASIAEQKSHHEFVFLSYGHPSQELKLGGHRHVILFKPKIWGPWYRRVFQKITGRFRVFALEHAVAKEKIDLVWFLIQDYEQCGCPYVYTVWDLQHRAQPWFPELNRGPHSYFERESHKDPMRRAAAVIAPNETSAKEISLFYGIPDDRLIRLHHPTPEFVFHVKPDYSIVPTTGRPFLVYPAQFWAHKNHICLVEAISVLEAKYGLVFDLVLTGSEKGTQFHVYQHVEKLGLKTRCFFPGFVTQAQLLGLYGKAAALVFPTFFGPENLPPLEAMACGLPAIVSDVAGARDQYGDAVLYFDPTDENALAEAVVQLMKESELKNALVEKGTRLSQLRRASEYIAGMLKFFDRFEKIRRTWY